MRALGGFGALGASGALAVLAVSGCGAGDAGDPTRIDGSDLAPLTAVEFARFGDVQDPDRGFSRIGGVEVDRDGWIYVLEAMVPEIRVLGPDGSLLHTIGGRGDGPAEFSSPPQFGVKGDTVWTHDIREGRIKLFSRSGALLSTGVRDPVRVPLPQGWGHVVPWMMQTDGRLQGWFGLVTYSRDDGPTGVTGSDPIPWPVVTFDPSGAVVDTIAWVAEPPPRMWRPPSEEPDMPELIEIGGRPRMVPNPPPPFADWHPLPDGRWIVDPVPPPGLAEPAFTATRVTLDGDTVVHRTVTYDPVPWTEAALDSIATNAARGGGGMLNPNTSAPDDWEAVAARLRQAMDYPESRPPLLYSLPGADGSLWMRRSRDESDPVAVWWVLHPDGGPLGRLELPAAARPLRASVDTLWASVPDDLEVPWLVGYRIERRR
jgi:hypothetical protein